MARWAYVGGSSREIPLYGLFVAPGDVVDCAVCPDPVLFRQTGTATPTTAPLAFPATVTAADGAVLTVRGARQPSTVYAVNDAVCHDGQVWRCVVGYTSTASDYFAPQQAVHWVRATVANAPGAGGTYLPGTLAGQPTASAFGVGLYFASDDNGGTLYRSDGTSWTKQAPGVNQAAGPALVAGPAKITANFTTTSTTDVDVTGLSITWTAVAGASYWIWLKGALGNTANAASGSLSLTDSANTVLDTCTYLAKSANDNAVVVLAAVVSPSAGSVTYKARLHASASTAFLLAGSTFPGQLQALRVA